jgi:CheY-like chemotaxis protein
MAVALTATECQALVEQAPIMIWRANTTAGCDCFNDRWLELRGRTMEQGTGNQWAEGARERELARLRGLLRICTTCKKIRNAAGARSSLRALSRAARIRISHTACVPIARTPSFWKAPSSDGDGPARRTIGSGTEKEKEKARTILLLDDDSNTLLVLRAILESARAKVIECETEICAVQHCEELRKSIDLLVADVVLQDSNGPVVVRKVKPLQPLMRLLYIGGFSMGELQRRGLLTAAAMAPGSVEFLQKPFSPRSVLGTRANASLELRRALMVVALASCAPCHARRFLGRFGSTPPERKYNRQERGRS